MTAFSSNKQVVIRGSGDIATGIAVRLHHCGYQVIMTDITLGIVVIHPLQLERCREGWHGPCARTARAQREA